MFPICGPKIVRIATMMTATKTIATPYSAKPWPSSRGKNNIIITSLLKRLWYSYANERLFASLKPPFKATKPFYQCQQVKIEWAYLIYLISRRLNLSKAEAVTASTGGS